MHYHVHYRTNPHLMKKAQNFTQAYLDGLQPTNKPYWKRDGACKGLCLKVQVNAGKYFYFVRQRGASPVPLGKYPEVTIKLAREECGRVLERVARSEDPKPLYRRPIPKQADNPTLNELFDEYADWFRRDRAANGYDSRGLEVIVTGLKAVPGAPDPKHSKARAVAINLGETHIANITEYVASQWREALKHKGLRSSTINRRVTGLRQLVGYAVMRKIVPANPFGALRPLDESHRETKALPRALTIDEIRRLTLAVAKRSDYLKPLVVLALNTGARRGELFRMSWSDVTLDGENPMVLIPKAKSGRPRYINLNSAARDALTEWRARQQPDSRALIFPGADGESRMVAIKTAWGSLRCEAQIPHRRFHDLRHSFVSRLLANGVPIAVAGQLVGHSTAQMTEMYGAGASELGGARAVESLVDAA